MKKFDTPESLLSEALRAEEIALECDRNDPARHRFLIDRDWYVDQAARLEKEKIAA